MLKRMGIIAVLSLMVAALAAVPALAQTPHFENLMVTSGPQPEATGSLVELTSGADVEIVLTVQGTATLTCQAPNGKTRLFSGVPVTATGSTLFPASLVGSGPLYEVQSFVVQATGTPVATGKKCPKSWASSLTNVVYTSGTVSAYQNDTLVAQEQVHIA